MASGLVFTAIPPSVARPSSGHADLRSARRLAGPPPRAAGASWWTPLFGWSAEPDYIDDAVKPSEAKKAEERRPARRFARFTEEKARELRMRTMEMEAEGSHKVMYRSAIASRLASDHPRRHPAAAASSADL